MKPHTLSWLWLGALTRPLFLPRGGPDAAWGSSKAAGARAYRQGDYAEAAKQFSVALKEAETLGPDPRLGTTLNNLALVYKKQGKFGKAEVLFRQALRVYKTARHAQHPHVASVLINLATLYGTQDRHPQAERLYQRAIAVAEKVLGAHHPKTAEGLEHYARLLRKTDREAKAAKMRNRAKAIRASQGKEGGQAKRR